MIDPNLTLKNCAQCVREKDDHAISRLTILMVMILMTSTITVRMKAPMMIRMRARITIYLVR